MAHGAGRRRGDVGGSTRRRETAASGEETERGGRDARARRAGMACGAKGDGAAGRGWATAHRDGTQGPWARGETAERVPVID